MKHLSMSHDHEWLLDYTHHQTNDELLMNQDNAFKSELVTCPACSNRVPEKNINEHLDNGCLNVAGSSTLSAKPAGHKTSIVAPVPESQANKSIAPIFNRGNVRSRDSNILSTPGSSSSKSAKRRVNDTHVTSQLPPAKRGKHTVTSHLQAAAPLAEKLRPSSLDDFIGQPHLTGPDSLLISTLNSGFLGSMIFWGPPGCGKTTLARLIAKRTDAVFKELSATVVGINDVRAVFEEAKGTLSLTGRKTILFLDEVHRFNKAQQDIFLPFVEQGHIQLIGATTENPSFKLTSALLSRCRVFVLERLTDDDIRQILVHAIERVSTSASVDASSEAIHISSSQSSSSQSEPSSSQTISSDSTLFASQSSAPDTRDSPFRSFPQITSKIISSITSLSTGDARTALSLLELVLTSPKDAQESNLLSSLRRSVSASYDRTGESHYDMISALHKSVRGSQGSAAMYWLARMLEGGEDPMYIARRMVVCASEDIGLADNHALPLAMATLQACQTIGMPECRINLAHCIAYLSEAPKSTRAYEAYNRAEQAAKLDLTLPVPLPLRNAPTKLMKELGYARGYSYNPDFAHPVTNEYLPSQLSNKVFLRKEGDVTGRIWDEAELRRWQMEENGGREWEGRTSQSDNTKNA